MNESNQGRKGVKLRVVEDSEKVERLLPSSDDVPFAESIEKPLVETTVERLQAEEETAPSKSKKGMGKSNKPEVAEILASNTVEEGAEEGWGKGRSLPIGWVYLTFAIVFCVSGWGIVKVIKGQEVVEEAEHKQQLLDEEIEEDELSVKKTLSAMRSCAAGYLGAKSVAEILPLVRHQSRVRPIIESHYAEQPMTPKKFVRFETFRSLALENYAFLYCVAVLEDGSQKNLLMEQVGEGKFVVDWESTECYQPMEWEEYIEQRPDKPLDMRVYASRDNFYAFEFTEENLLCLRLEEKDSDKCLYGYVDKNSEDGKKIRQFFMKTGQVGGGDREPLLLRLRFPKAEESRSKKCVWIDRILSERWIYIESPSIESKDK
ncbi:MAG: hypothetical protein ACPG32_11255 [Akkermansiaceae bacterium]